MTAPTRQSAGDAVAGLFGRPSLTGGLARQDEACEEPVGSSGAAAGAEDNDRDRGQRRDVGKRSSTSQRVVAGERHARVEPRVRLGVELTEREVAFLRSMSRPARTGGPRTLGGKFVATGVLAAAIELLRTSQVDMSDVAAGDLEEMTARARAGLLAAGGDGSDGGER